MASSLPYLRQVPDIDVLHALSLVGTDAERARSLLSRAAAGYEANGMPRHQARAAALMR